MTVLTGTVVAAHGRHYFVRAGDALLQCVTRGKKSDVAVGDIVNLMRTSANQAVIESIAPRKTLIFRSDQYKSKLLAANVTQLMIMVATEPGFSDDLVSRALVAAEAAEVRPRLLLNKVDLKPSLERARERVKLYAGIGYPVHEISVSASPEATRAQLLPLLKGQSTLLVGQSGMGKSSLVNLLAPDADAAVKEISLALDAGKHTTTFTRLYPLDGDTALIDSPGFQEFGLYHLTEGKLERAFPEFRPHLGHCRFHNCHHLAEPQCAVLDAVREGSVASARHDLYRQLLHEINQTLY